MMKILAFVRVVPIGTSTTSLGSYVAEAIKVIKSLGVNYQVTPFGTGVELNSFEDLTKLISLINEKLRSLNISRLLIDVSLDLRYDKEISLEYKVKSVQEKVGK
jgi:uncharacterized protein (TIGR00106 family)